MICAAVTQYRATRNECRSLIGSDRFIEVYVNTPLEVCESRDRKGMYARARAGQITNFTGIDDPYEVPTNPEIILDTIDSSPETNADRILSDLITRGFIQDFVSSEHLSQAQ